MTGKMAAAELKQNHVLSDGNTKSTVLPVISHRETDCYQFKTLDLVYYVLSISFFVMDIATDSIVFVRYILQGHLMWGYIAMSLTILPNCIIQLFSLRWHHSDGSLKNIHWILHLLFLGVLHRYLTLLYSAMHSLRTKQCTKDVNWLHRQESDICMLHLFASFMGAAPQLVLQMYVMIILRRAPLWTWLSAVASFCSLIWAIGTYTKAKQKINVDDRNSPWVALTFQALWRCGMLVSRIAGLVLIAACIRKWFFLFFGLHWLCTTAWVISQNTDFCPTLWEERIYNCIIGLIYCFDFFNLRVGKSRYRVFVFYFVIVVENLAFVITYISYFKDTARTATLMITAVTIVGSMLIGLSSMILYYLKFHPTRAGDAHGPTSECTEIVVGSKAATPRTLKQCNQSSLVPQPTDLCQQNVSEEVTADKQFLLSNIVQSVECTEEGNVNQACCTENESSAGCCAHEKTENCTDGDSVELTDRQKRRGICLPIIDDLDIDTIITEEAGASLAPQKELEHEDWQTHTDLRNINPIPKKHLSNNSFCLHFLRTSIALDTIKERDKLDTPTFLDSECSSKMEKFSKDETMSYVTSIHDYENLCPLGVARPPWCIRSWKGYTDIETYIHDDSVVRDRRRDTLTSTTTGTTYSSDFSDTTCASSLVRGILKQNDYLDTLIYDLVDSREGRTIYNENFGPLSNAVEQNPTVYIAKPVVIDDKGGMLALDTIVEEHGDETDRESSRNSASTLVSTIDQIRKCTAENSPMHVYHKTESQCDDMDSTNRVEKSQLTKALFPSELNDAFALNSNYVNSVSRPVSIVNRHEVDTIRELIRNCAIETIKQTPLIDAILSDSPVLGNRAKMQKHNAVLDGKGFGLNEDDLYVEMNPLVLVESGENVSKYAFQCSRTGRGIVAEPAELECELSKDSPRVQNPFTSGGKVPYEKCKKNVVATKRRLSLLKEKLDPTSRLVYVVTPNSAIVKQSSDSLRSDSLNKHDASITKSDPALTNDKENLVPTVSSVLRHSAVQKKDCGMSEKNDDVYERERPPHDVQLALEGKGDIFLHQDMSPPKFFAWGKRNFFKSGSHDL